MRGYIRERGENYFELSFDLEADATGKRKRKFHSFRGSKREAQRKLAELIAGVSGGSYIEPSKLQVADFVRGRIDQWEASGTISARTAQRYRQLCEKQIAPQIGSKVVQKLRPIDIEAWHNELRKTGSARGTGVSPQTIRHAHRLLGKALSDAMRSEIVSRNVCTAQPAPKVPQSDLAIVRDIPAFLAKLKGERLEHPATVALFTGMRLGEVFGLRWGRVDLDKKTIEVCEALEETKAHGVTFKAPKTNAGRRTVTLPDLAVTALREHRRELLEIRLQLGAGKLSADDLVFPTLEGGPQSPSYLSKAWSDLARRIGFPEITFHALRHTHASQLIDASIDVVTISNRLGHAKPDITLRVYAHLFRQDDSKAANAINAAFGNS